jgi:hypothetical protein
MLRERIPSPSEALRRAVEFLSTVQHNDGGWGYTQTNRQSFTEPTGWASRALASSSVFANIERAISFLKNSHNDDGGWSNLFGLPSDITTAHATLALSELGLEQTLSRAGVCWLQRNEVGRKGWGWCRGSTGFAEPLAYSILALAAANSLTEGERLTQLLLSYQCDDGGWNCHVPTMHGRSLESQTSFTAISIIALLHSDATIKEELFKRAMVRIEDDVRRGKAVTSYTIALTLWAFCEAGRSRSELSVGLADALCSSLDSNGSWEHNILWTGVGCVALRCFTDR